MHERRRLDEYRKIGFGEAHPIYRPHSACDMASFFRDRRPLIPRAVNEARERIEARPVTVNRYDYLGPSNRTLQRPSYHKYHSLSYLNRKQRSRSPTGLLNGIRRERPQPLNPFFNYNRRYEAPARLAQRDMSGKHLPRKIHPHNYFDFGGNNENIGRNNRSVEKIHGRLENLLKERHGIKKQNACPLQAAPKNKPQRRLNQHVNSPLGLNLDVILTESIIQVPSRGQYR